MTIPADVFTPFEAEVTAVTTADGSRLHALCAGNGRTVVLAHGYGVTHAEWDRLANRLLSKGRRVVVFDQRGHGASTVGRDGIDSSVMSSDYRAVLEHFDARNAVLVGHSMGGFLALRFMLDHPEVVATRLSHAMIVASLAGNVFEGSLQNRLQIPMIRSGLLARMLGVRPIARAFCRSLAGDEWTDVMMQHFIPTFRATDHRRLWPILQDMGVEDLCPRLSALDVPCTIVLGEQDKTTPPQHGREMARRIRGAELISVPGARHCLNIEAADLLTERLLALSE